MTSTVASGCNFEDNEKIKFSANEEDISSAKKIKLNANEENICKFQNGTNAADHENCKKYIIGVEMKICKEHGSSDQAWKSFFSSLMEKAGCSESQISSHATYCFFTVEQAKKSGVDNVKQVTLVQRYDTPESVRSMQGHDWKSNILQTGKDMNLSIIPFIF